METADQGSVIVVGGGIGGLAAALALAQKGIAVRPFERATAFMEIGAGIQLGPNVFRMFECLGVTDEINRVAVFPENVMVRCSEDRELAQSPTRTTMADLNVISICGSLRKGSFNAALQRALPSLAPAGMKITPAPAWADIPIYNFDLQGAGWPAPVTAWADAIRNADGVIIVSPEYNWTIPGGLKNAIDWTSRMKDDPFKGKPVAIQSCASGLLGGARMQYHLRQSLASVEAVILRPEVFVNFAAKKFAEGSLELTDQATKDMVKLQLEAFEKLVRQHNGKG